MVRYDFQGESNNQHGNLKINQDDYIETTIEPFDSEIDAKMSAEIEIEMAETIYDMRREFKRQNKKMRKLYSTKEPKKAFYKSTKPAKVQRFSKRHAAA
ncbi:MAG: hypothetical protein NTV39_02700 [Candidatus Saccharibacteria bacterium]|nr:hypothetical protein [Candidatus Saccharibacteria bacterium]